MIEVEVPLYLVGAPAFPLLPWLLKVHPHDGMLTPVQNEVCR